MLKTKPPFLRIEFKFKSLLHFEIDDSMKRVATASRLQVSVGSKHPRSCPSSSLHLPLFLSPFPAPFPLLLASPSLVFPFSSPLLFRAALLFLPTSTPTSISPVLLLSFQDLFPQIALSPFFHDHFRPCPFFPSPSFLLAVPFLFLPRMAGDHLT